MFGRLFGRRRRRTAESLPALAAPSVPEPESGFEPEREPEPSGGPDSEISPARLDAALQRLREEIPAPEEPPKPLAEG